MPAAAPENDIASLSFEVALEQLERIVDELERGKVGLEQSIEICERGEKLKAHCGKLLKSAEAKIEKITLASGGAPAGTAPLDPE